MTSECRACAHAPRIHRPARRASSCRPEMAGCQRSHRPRATLAPRGCRRRGAARARHGERSRRRREAVGEQPDILGQEAESRQIGKCAMRWGCSPYLRSSVASRTTPWRPAPSPAASSEGRGTPRDSSSCRAAFGGQESVGASGANVWTANRLDRERREVARIALTRTRACLVSRWFAALRAVRGPKGSGVTSRYALIIASTSSRFACISSGEATDSRFRRIRGSVFEPRTLKCQLS